MNRFPFELRGQPEAGVGYQSTIFSGDILAMPIDKNIIMLTSLQ
jgi:hypothetical protein